MSFFDEPPSSPEPVVEPDIPEWAGPPHAVLPGVSTQAPLVFKSDEAAATIQGFLVYPNGISFSFDLWLKEGIDPKDMDHIAPLHRAFTGRPGGRDPDGPRLGLQFPDGSRWTNLSATPYDPRLEPVTPFVTYLGSRGGTSHWSSRLWMLPLPGPGELMFHVAWDARGIPESSLAVDTAEFRRLAGEAEELWPT